MGKKKEDKAPNTPKWWDQRPQMQHIRNFEDAAGDYLLDIQIDPMIVPNDDLVFEDLLQYLRVVDERWKGVKIADFKVHKHICFKGIWQMLKRLKSNPKKCKELMKSRNEEDSETDVKDVPSKLVPEILQH